MTDSGKRSTTVKGTNEEPIVRKECPEKRANIISRIFLTWVFGLVYKGWKKPLEDEDLWELREFERGEYTTTNLINAYRQVREEDKGGSSLNIALLRNYRRALLATGTFKIFDVVLGTIQPVFVNRLLVFLASGDPLRVGIGWAFSLLIAPLLKTLFENHYFMRTMRGGMQVRSSLQGTIYDKSLRMSPSARASSSLGEIVNLMQLDTQRIGDFFQFSHTLWSAPVQIIVTVGLLFNYIGVSAIIGLFVTLATLPLQVKLMSQMIKLRKASIGITDRRVKLMNEILQGIKGVKFYAWEDPFAKAVEKERTEEVKKFRGTVWLRSAFLAIMMVIPVIIAVITFSFFSGVFKQKLDPARVFTGLALLNQLRVPVMMLPMTINALIDARIGLKRIERFLNLEDTDNYSRDSAPEKNKSSLDDDEQDTDKVSSSESSDYVAASIDISNGEFAWSPIAPAADPTADGKGLLGMCLPGRRKKNQTSQEANSELKTGEGSNGNEEHSSVGRSVLRNISIKMGAGQLVAIVGRVGSGKSSLIHAVLGEMRKIQGDVRLEGSVAYVAQTAWIFNDTLRNNILFGKKFDEKLYRKALKVSSLDHDISILPAGDMTAIGEKGINLSGGQKQRVSIARAVYADADVYLFDDPLSALDAHVSREVFERCISRKGVLRNRLRVLITNQVHVLPECDKIIFLESGTVKGSGKYSQLLRNEPSFGLLINEQEKSNEDEKESPSVDETANMSVDTSKHSTSIAPQPATKSVDASIVKPDEKDGKNTNAGKSLMQSEERKMGNVLAHAYYQYAIACGGILMFTVMLFFWCATVALSVIVNWWLAFWAEQEATGTNKSLGFFMGIYFALAVGYAIAVMLRSMWFLTLALYASKKLHNSMLKSVLHAPMTFFDTTPIGRIISRFSRDVSVLDELLPQYFSQMMSTLLNLIASYVYIGIVLPLFFAVAIPVTVGYFLLQRFFNRTSVELKRLDAISKSPIYAHFSETLGGLSTLRAYAKQGESRDENMKMIDINQRAYFSWIASNRWFSLNLEMAGSTLIFATALFGVLRRDNTFAGDIGLSLTYALQVTGILGFSVRSITELEGQMSSVERANYYSKELPQEAAAEVEGGAPEGWPSRGQIDVKDVQLRYREGLELVLKGVNLSITAGEKVGVVGRTGSGKSSLMIALLRMVELSGGQITVDGVDLRDLGLNDVRSQITIIPQDPVIFSGTIRFNLDPFNQHTDLELWDALEKSHMKEFVQEFDGGLDAIVSEYGENMSAGQRQVICLTRALLRNSKILILDEASSSLDMETDRMIQQTIRTHLKDATILTIAHRLFTLADYDKVIVMDQGLAVEFASPAELLADPDSKFTGLVESMGAQGAARFRELVAAGASET